MCQGSTRGAVGTTVQGNFIGTDLSGTLRLGNSGHGIYLDSVNTLIGGPEPGEGNVIAFNSGNGVGVAIGAVGDSIRGNSIYGNALIGIDLRDDGVTPNDPLDTDGTQNFPIVTSAIPLLPDSGTNVQGTFNSLPATTYTLDFYANPACSPRPHDFLQGQTYLGSTMVTTDASGKVPFNVNLAPTIQPGQQVTGTATNPNGTTSEFSQRIVFSLSRASGAPSPGTPITIFGTNFEAGASVLIGGAPATSVSIPDYTTIYATTPSLPPGSVNDVTVTDTDGTTGSLRNGWVADFLDVPGSNQFYSYVITLAANEITSGVGGGNFGVNLSALRQQMAVFLLKGRHSLCYTPPPCTGVFADVPCPSTFADWIEALAAEGITGGCGGGNFCPTSPVLRQQMAVLLLKTEHGSGYVPPPCTGVFLDVPCPSTFADWIERLAAEMITGGCGGGNFCPTNPNTRGQMAVFIVKTFNLQ